MSERSVINRLINIVTNTSTSLAMISMFLMMLLITLDVILNKLIGRPIPGTIEVTSFYFMVLVVFLSLSYIEKKQSHISADFIVARFSRRAQGIYSILGKLLTIGFYSLMAYGAITQAIKSTKRLETVMSNFTFYIWPARWGVVLGIVSGILVIVMMLIQRSKNNS